MNAMELKNQVPLSRGPCGLVSVPPEASLEEAVGVMRSYEMHHLLVMEGDRVLGLIDAADLFLRGFPLARETRVGEVMAKSVAQVEETTEVREAVRRMRESRLTAVALVKDGKVSGILTATDLLRWMDTFLKPPKKIETLVESGEAFFANPLVQNVVQTLAQAGI